MIKYDIGHVSQHLNTKFRLPKIRQVTKTRKEIEQLYQMTSAQLKKNFTFYHMWKTFT